MKRTLFTTALLLASISLFAQAGKADSIPKFSVLRSFTSWVGSQIQEYGKGEYELPGGKYHNGILIVTDSAKAINELMKGYIILNNRIPKIYDEMSQEVSREHKNAEIYRKGYERMRSIVQSMLANQKNIINSLTKKQPK